MDTDKVTYIEKEMEVHISIYTKYSLIEYLVSFKILHISKWEKYKFLNIFAWITVPQNI